MRETATYDEIAPIKLSQLVKEVSFQVRNKVNTATVKRYADLMKAGVNLSPIRVARVDGMLMLVDGWHRVAAHEQLGKETALAEIVECNRQQAQWMAAKANLTHGLQLKNAEYRNVFRAYISTRQHLKGRGGHKSYREIGVEIGKPYTTIRNWMLKDFPEIAARMAGDDLVGEGGLQPVEGPSIDPARDHLTRLIGVFQSSADPVFRGEIIGAVRETLADMEASGGWHEPPPPQF
jgi:uncharacterized ParB-like nuclease family protein